MTLVDTSVWVQHLRRRSARLTGLLTDGAVVCHPLVIGELACGRLPARDELLGLLQDLPAVPGALHEEVLRLVDAWGLAGQGLGWVDAHLLASARLARVPLWTLDRPLAAAALRLGLAPG